MSHFAPSIRLVILLKGIVAGVIVFFQKKGSNHGNENNLCNCRRSHDCILDLGLQRHAEIENHLDASCWPCWRICGKFAVEPLVFCTKICRIDYLLSLLDIYHLPLLLLPLFECVCKCLGRQPENTHLIADKAHEKVHRSAHRSAALPGL